MKDSDRVLLLIQGPIYKPDGHAGTLDALQALAGCVSRPAFRVVLLCWADEHREDVDALRPYADDVLMLSAPERAGSCHRNLQAYAVNAGIRAHGDLPFALKCRSDIVLSEAFLKRVLELASGDYQKLCVTNLFTRLEPFHVSDFVVFGRTADVSRYFHDGPVYYEDLYSPEVQFTRSYIRGRGLKYRFTLEDYLRFLRDQIDLADFQSSGLEWLKWRDFSAAKFHATRPLLGDRDVGPLLCRLITPRLKKYIDGRGKKVLSLTALVIQLIDPLLRFWATRLSLRTRNFYWIDGKHPEYERPLENSAEASSQCHAARPSHADQGNVVRQVEAA